MSDTRTEDFFEELLANAEEEVKAGASKSQFLIALRRAGERRCEVDLHAPVASFGSAF